MPSIDLDSASTIAENTAKAYQLTLDAKTVELFVVRRNNRYFAYFNHCPHTGVNLNWQPDQFFDFENRFIQCATHGALFQVEDGLCIRGPCAGAKLQSIPVNINNDRIEVTLNKQ